MLDAELKWGITHPSVQENAVAQYGMVNVFTFDFKSGRNGWINNIGHKVSHVGESQDHFDTLRSFLDGGFIKDCKTVFAHCHDIDDVMTEPLLLIDLDKYKFWVQRKRTSLLLTWTMTDQMLNIQKAIEVKQLVKTIELNQIVTPRVETLRERESREIERMYRDY